MADLTTATPPLGTYQLFVPWDWVDLLADPDGETALRAFRTMAAQLYPTLDVTSQRDIATGVLAWRDHLLAGGAIMHGLVAGMADDGHAVQWHVLAGVVDVPQTGDVSITELIARVFSSEWGADAVYVEKFPTEMGAGVGMVTEFVLDPVSGSALAVGDAAADAPRLGLAAVLACPPTGGAGLLVIGVCADPDDAPALAGAVAVIAGNSLVHAGGL